MKSVLGGVEGDDGFNECLLFQLVLNRQAEFGELFDVAARMKLHLSEFGEDGKRLLVLRRVRFVILLPNLAGWRRAAACGRSVFPFVRLRPFMVVFFLRDLLLVRYVSRITHGSD